MIPVIDKGVDRISKISYRGSLIFIHFLIWCFERDSEQPERDRLSKFFSQLNANKSNKYDLFICCCFLLDMKVDHCRKPTNFNILSEFWESKKDLYTLELSRINGDGQALTYITNQYATNFTTYMKFTVNTRPIEHITLWGETNNVFSDKKKDEIFGIRSKINGWHFKPKTAMKEEQFLSVFIIEKYNKPGKRVSSCDRVISIDLGRNVLICGIEVVDSQDTSQIKRYRFCCIHNTEIVNDTSKVRMKKIE